MGKLSSLEYDCLVVRSASIKCAKFQCVIIRKMFIHSSYVGEIKYACGGLVEDAPLIPFMQAQLVVAGDEPAMQTERDRSSLAGGKIGKEVLSVARGSL